MQRLYEVVTKHFGLDDLSPDTHLFKDLRADDLDVIEVVMLIEESFDISISDEEIENFQTLQDMYDCVAKKI